MTFHITALLLESHNRTTSRFLDDKNCVTWLIELDIPLTTVLRKFWLCHSRTIYCGHGF